MCSSAWACDVIVDLLGFYEPVTSVGEAGRYKGPRLGCSGDRYSRDVRFAAGNSYTWVDLTSFVPQDASSVVLNLTATECTGPGYFTALPASAGESSRPLTSSLNVVSAGDTRAASVIVPVPTVGGKRRIKIFTRTAAKLIVDVNGYYTSDASELSSVGLFVPMAPDRILDTRAPGEIGRLWPRWVVERKLPAAWLPTRRRSSPT